MSRWAPGSQNRVPGPQARAVPGLAVRRQESHPSSLQSPPALTWPLSQTGHWGLLCSTGNEDLCSPDVSHIPGLEVQKQCLLFSPDISQAGGL